MLGERIETANSLGRHLLKGLRRSDAFVLPTLGGGDGPKRGRARPPVSAIEA